MLDSYIYLQNAAWVFRGNAVSHMGLYILPKSSFGRGTLVQKNHKIILPSWTPTEDYGKAERTFQNALPSDRPNLRLEGVKTRPPPSYNGHIRPRREVQVWRTKNGNEGTKMIEKKWPESA
jgi:hypothetical protein